MTTRILEICFICETVPVTPHASAVTCSSFDHEPHTKAAQTFLGYLCVYPREVEFADLSSGRCCEVLRGDASVRLDSNEPRELSLPHKMRGCHSMVPILQCIDTTTIRALRRPVSKEVWDNNSVCCRSNIPWRLGSTKRKTRAEYRRGFSPGMACIMYGIKYRNMCLCALVEIFYSLDLRGNGDLLEKNRL
jgi:hypothetical protein